jgi:hypothetical protein
MKNGSIFKIESSGIRVEVYLILLFRTQTLNQCCDIVIPNNN